MRVLICGTRTFQPDLIIDALIHGLWQIATQDGDELVVINGDCRGADRLSTEAIAAISSPDATCAIYPADWRQYGRAAGPIRNKQMLVDGKPEFVVAFTEKPLSETKGTADMVKQARRAGVPVCVVQVDQPEPEPPQQVLGI